MPSASTAELTPTQLAVAQRAARVAAAATHRFGEASPPPGYHEQGGGPSRQPLRPTPSRHVSAALLGSPTPPRLLNVLWTHQDSRPLSHSAPRLARIQELGEACREPGRNRMLDFANDFSPTAPARETGSLTDMLLDGYARGSGYNINTSAGQELHDNCLMPRQGGPRTAAFQAMMHPPPGSEAEDSTVLLCQLQAIEVCRAHGETQSRVICTTNYNS